MDRKKIKERYLKDIQRILRVEFMKSMDNATSYELYYAVAKLSMDEVTKAWKKTEEKYCLCQLKQVNYFSQEFLPGRLLGNNLSNSGTREIFEEILTERGLSLNFIEEQEDDPALGNGGLGRLASCIMESLTTHGYHACGYSIRYKNGLFKQKIVNGRQTELPDCWENGRYPLGVERKEYKQNIIFGGGANKWIVEAVPFDVPIVGFATHGHEDVKVNTLRLWDAVNAPEITECLYPNDNTPDGKLLRLKQQYFFVSASIQLIVKQFKAQYRDFKYFPKKVCLHINDTHPAIMIPELMRILMDEEGLSWDDAWEITTKSCAYTNHTIMKEALETWQIGMFKYLLPRVYQIIEEIDKRFVSEIRKNAKDAEAKVKSMAVLYDGQIRMANLAVIGSFSVNGVAKLHTEILKDSIFSDFNEIMGEKFNNKTNGVTQRRFLFSANRPLSTWISEKCRTARWLTDMECIKKLENFADDEKAQSEFLTIKYQNKVKLAKVIRDRTGIIVNPSAIFDVQIKRQHEYKRQLMNVLRIRYLYNLLKNDEEFFKSFHPMVFIFAGKAHSDYEAAKRIIFEINKAADEINNDESIKNKMKVVFLENYNVSLAEKIFPASDVSEQISTASKEASGTGNMKFMMNGAVTIGTLDGANVEIEEAVGRDNIFIFGKDSKQIMELEKSGEYIASHICIQHELVRYVVNKLCPDVAHTLIYGQGPTAPADKYFVLLDLLDYVAATIRLNEAYKDPFKWARMAIINIANSGRFSIDRTVHEYAKEVWNIESIYED